ncbi:MAG: DUF4830 domain-containing protein, partial [Paraclostridium sp.]
MGRFKNNKVVILLIIGIFLIVGTTILVSYNILNGDNYGKEEGFEGLKDRLKNTEKILVYHDYHEENIDNIKPVEVSDKAIIKNYLALISKNIKKSEDSLSGDSINNQKLIFITNNEEVEISYSYDNLYEFGYITYNEQRVDIDYDFFRLIKNTQRYEPKKANIKMDVYELFKKYDYTPSFLINTYKEILPKDLKYAPEKGISELYWAYNLELSKGIGMNFSNLLSKEVEAEVYYLLEEMPKLESPIKDTTAVVIRHKGEIVGAYIDSGIVNRAVATLDGKSFEDVTGSSIEEFLINNNVDKNSKLNKEVSKLSNEELIKTYYKSKEDREVSKYLSTLDIGCIVNLLQPENMDLKYELFNKIDKDNGVFRYSSKTDVLEVEKDKNVSKTEKEINI